MRKRMLWTGMMMAAMITVMGNLTGCIVIQTSPQPSSSASVETVDPSPMDIQMADDTQAVTDTQAAAESQTAAESQAAVESQSTTKAAEVGTEQAKKFAYDHAGVTEAEIKYSKVDTDWENGSLVYEVEFVANGMEYDYEISSSGIVMKWEIERAD